MCCFSLRVESVTGTRIFARGLGDLQALVYQMTLASEQAVAMILPLPVVVGCGDDAVQFVDLQGYERFFDDVQRAFPVPAAPKSFGPVLRSGPPPQKLVVHTVGKFEASFVPTVSDFDRLDARFRLPRETWEKIPHYRDWGFAVFQLKDFDAGIVGTIKRAFGAVKKETIHPMAFTFPRRDTSSIFFPTMHIHDGQVHEQADFDHALYLQHDASTAPDAQWLGSMGPASQFVDVGRARGLVDADRLLWSRAIAGKRKNEDVVVRVERDPRSHAA